jgi:CopG family nickel-responsive transcriptional regulator
MKKTVRFGVSLDHHLLEDFDKWVDKKKYVNRSEAIRDLIRDHLVEQEWDENKETVGTISIVYTHDVRELTDTLTDLQHQHHMLIKSGMHVHLDEHNCLEVLVVKGRAGEIKKIADQLIGIRGVKHGKLTMTTTGKEIV